MIFISCPKCNTNLQFDDSLADTPVSCPICGEKFMVPAKRVLKIKRPKVMANGDVVEPAAMPADMASDGSQPSDTPPTENQNASETPSDVIDANDDSWFIQRKRGAQFVSELKQANPLIRLFARVLDLTIGAAAASYLLMFLMQQEILVLDVDGSMNRYIWLGVVIIVVIMAAFILESLFYLIFRITVGKVLFGITIQQADGKELSRLRYMIRNMGVFISGCGAVVLCPIAMLRQFIRLMKGREASYDASMRLKVSTAHKRRFVAVLGSSLMGLILFVCLFMWTYYLIGIIVRPMDEKTCYEYGFDAEFGADGQAQDYQKAVYWYQRALKNRDYAPAAYRLGCCYFEGNGVSADVEKAKEYWKKAADDGVDEAKKALLFSQYEQSEERMFTRLDLIRITPGMTVFQGKTIQMEQAYWIGQFEVTKKLWHALGYPLENVDVNDESWKTVQKEPVTNITRKQAVQFCEKLNRLYGKRCPFGYKFSLPSINQWQYAAFGGRKATNMAIDVKDTLLQNQFCLWRFNSENKLGLVGSKRPNELNLFDTRGNAREFCAGKTSQKQIPVCGGSYQDDLPQCLPDTVQFVDEKYKGPETGFRVVLAPEI